MGWLTKPRFLWSFKGSQITHAVRKHLFELCAPDAFVEDTSARSLPNLMRKTNIAEQKQFLRGYCDLLRDSAFIVCPRGVGASSMRIFEAMRAGRAPVVISDDWTPPPFVNWDRCCLRISEKQIKELPDYLRQDSSEAEQLGQTARKEWERVFGEEGLVSSHGGSLSLAPE